MSKTYATIKHNTYVFVFERMSLLICECSKDQIYDLYCGDPIVLKRRDMGRDENKLLFLLDDRQRLAGIIKFAQGC